MISVKYMPLEEQPRNRLIRNGAKNLSNQELLAIILRTGYKDIPVLELASLILKQIGDIRYLNTLTVQELANIKGIGKIKAVEILAMMELSLRAIQPVILSFLVSTPETIYKYLQPEMQNLEQETLECLYLNTKGHLIIKKIISIGSTNYTPFNVKEILKHALKVNAYAIIIAHNHPSGDSSPSNNDVNMTEKLLSAAKLMDIILLDHIIIGKNTYYSFKENGYLF